MHSAAELQHIKIQNLKEGREVIAQIDKRMALAKESMQLATSNTSWKWFSDERYELKKAKRNIQSQMQKIVAQTRQSR